MLKFKRSDWIIVLGLFFLTIIPLIAGVVRVVQVANGPVTHENIRFSENPISIVVHIFSVSIYSLLGIFQFPPAIRNGFPKFHRLLGRALLPMAMLSAVTGLWMTIMYPWTGFDGKALYLVRLLVGTLMLGFIVAGIVAVVKRKYLQHGAWMIRAYALGLGAGTQVLTHIPWFVFPTIQGETSRAVFMALGWLINSIVAEWIIKQHFTKRVL